MNSSFLMEIGFILKKIIGGMLMPIPILLILLFITIIFLYKRSYRKAQYLLFLSFLMLFILSVSPISNGLLSVLEKNDPIQLDQKKFLYIAVLGSSHVTNTAHSIVSQMDEASLARVTEAVILHKKFPHTKLIFSGYGGEDSTPHALMQKKLAIELGIQPQDIITLTTPKDTEDEAIAIKSCIHDAPFVLITSAFHMPRALLTFKNHGLAPYPVSTGYLSSNQYHFKRPSGTSLRNSEIAIWEYIGIFYQKLKSFKVR